MKEKEKGKKRGEEKRKLQDNCRNQHGSQTVLGAFLGELSDLARDVCTLETV